MANDTYDLSAYNRMRFHPGWPLTRVIYKGVYVLGRLHKHDQEAEVLRSLLGQRVFRRGRRGDWYDRLALIIAHYPPSDTISAVRKAKREALSIAVQGIEDPDTHLIYQDTLQRRIVRLESQLKLPFSEKHDFSYAKLFCLAYNRFVDDKYPCSNEPKQDRNTISRPIAKVTHEQQRGISKSKTQRRNKITSRRASRPKHALASSVQEYEYLRLGEARRASNGSIEVEVRHGRNRAQNFHWTTHITSFIFDVENIFTPAKGRGSGTVVVA